MLRLALVAAAAFLAGAVVYHTVAGNLPFEFGPVKVARTVRAVRDGTEEVREAVAELNRIVHDLNGRFERLKKGTSGALHQVAKDVALLERGLHDSNLRLDQLKDQTTDAIRLVGEQLRRPD